MPGERLRSPIGGTLPAPGQGAERGQCACGQGVRAEKPQAPGLWLVVGHRKTSEF